jgi:hypothetical protein
MNTGSVISRNSSFETLVGADEFGDGLGRLRLVLDEGIVVHRLYDFRIARELPNSIRVGG